MPLQGAVPPTPPLSRNPVKPPNRNYSPHPAESIPNIFPANVSQLPPANCYSKIRSQRWNRSARPRQNRADACRPTGPKGDHAGHLQRRLPHTASSHTGLVALSERTRSGSDHSTSLLERRNGELKTQDQQRLRHKKQTRSWKRRTPCHSAHPVCVCYAHAAGSFGPTQILNMAR
jgi:hypothetical protein